MHILKYSQPYTLEELERYTDGSFEPAASKTGIILLLTGEKVKNIGIILSGNVEISPLIILSIRKALR